MKTFTLEEIDERLAAHKGWNLVNGAIEKHFVHEDFKRALAFIVEIGLFAEQANHHPEIFNVYNMVTIRLNTHSVKGITDKDFELAKNIDSIYN